MPKPPIKLMRSLWGVVIQEPALLDPLLGAGNSSGSRSKSIPSTLDHKLFPSRQAFFQHLKTNGFKGIEASLTDLGTSMSDLDAYGPAHTLVLPLNQNMYMGVWIAGTTKAERQAYAQALADAGLEMVVGIYSSWQDYEDRADHYKPATGHLAQLEEQLREVSR